MSKDYIRGLMLKIKIEDIYVAPDAKFEETSMCMKAYKVYGVDGHRQRASFGTSDGIVTPGRAVFTICSDLTGTNEYAIIVCMRPTEKECEEEFWSQLSDGVFENCKTGVIEEIKLKEGRKDMKKYVVEFYDYENGATSAIDQVEAPEGYTAEDYIRGCKADADDEWNEMLAHGEVYIVPVED